MESNKKFYTLRDLQKMGFLGKMHTGNPERQLTFFTPEDMTPEERLKIESRRAKRLKLATQPVKVSAGSNR